MKNSIRLSQLIFAATLGVAPFQSALAERMDLPTHNGLIQKLESVVNTESSDQMLLNTNMAYRLADLYAERARLLAMEQQGQGEKINAAAIASDRKKAINMLSRVVNSLSKKDQGPALLQMAHLHILQSETAQALAIYKQIEKNAKQYDGKTNSLVQIQLGDSQFVQGEFSQAMSHFTKALQYKENPRKAYTLFRIAWVNYNQEKTQLAEKQLISLLKSPKLFVTNSGSVDTSFQEEVSHDLALFMAKNDISNSSVQTLSELSPQNTRKKNLIFLASELDRTAKKVSALKVWKVIGTHHISFEDQLERQIQITRIEYDLGHKKALLVEINRSLELIRDPKCGKSDECTVATQNLRRVITDWAKAEERVPSAELVQAFKIYTTALEDYEMNYWAAQSASIRQQYKDAFQFQDRAIKLLQVMNNRNAVQQKMFEGALLGSIEMAELSKDAELRMQAYKRYLDVNPNGAKASEVKYQIAHWYYEKADYQTASQQFRTLALDKKMPLDLREKSADLCLDSDVLLKNEPTIEAHSLELAQAVPSKKSEYLSIYRKSILNQSAQVLNENKTQVYEKELTKLSGLSLGNFSSEEVKQITKNKMDLAYRLKDIDALIASSKALLDIKGITKEERELAWHHLAWIAEIKMNFKLAVKLMEKIEPSPKQRADYYLKMATLKELANENPTQAYENFLSVSRDSVKRSFVAHQLVIYSKKPAREFKAYEHLLAKNPALYSSAGIYVYEKTKDEAFARNLLRKSSVRNSFHGQLISHTFAFQDLQKVLKQISQAKLKAKSDSALKRTLVTRDSLIKQLEKSANKAITGKDTVLQFVYLSHVSEQKNALASEILALPLPRGLKVDEKAQYQAQVQAMVQPYLDEAKAVQAKTKELWAQALAKNSFSELTECTQQKAKPGCQLAALEMGQLRASAARIALSTAPFEKLSEQHQKTLSEAEVLKLRIQENPFNLNDLAKLKVLHTSLGRGPMVAYLNNRMNELQTKEGKN